MHLVHFLVRPPISIHAPRVGSDTRIQHSTLSASRFQSTLPAWGATAAVAAVFELAVISIHAPRVGSDLEVVAVCVDLFISIHAPRVGSDSLSRRSHRVRSNFNPRSPRGERRSTSVILASPPAFQSTLPAWGATTTGDRRTRRKGDFNPRSPRGERLQSAFLFRRRYYFNPRSPRGERLSPPPLPSRLSNFNPRSPRGERRPSRLLSSARRISIHAPRVGSDPSGLRMVMMRTISIHAPRVGSDLYFLTVKSQVANFNPRSPRGERQPS